MNKVIRNGITFRIPTTDDGTDMWQIVQESGSLDTNSAYAYLMMCDMFAHTSSAAFHNDEMIGFAIGFRKPANWDTLFIWQIGVRRDYQGQGVAKRLLLELLWREGNQSINFLEATIGPTNSASRKLFESLAFRYKTPCNVTEHYTTSQFPETGSHEAELLFRIGPINPYREVDHEVK